MIVTDAGKPRGFPIWNSFENVASKRIMNNETMASTFMSLAKNLSEIGTDKDKNGKVMRVSLENKTYNVFSPYLSDDFQISFVVVFEDKDTILIQGKHKEELVRKIVEKLRENQDLRSHLLSEGDKTIKKDSELYKEVSLVVSQVIVKWDGKRVKYLEKQEKQERKRLLKELEAQAKV